MVLLFVSFELKGFHSRTLSCCSLGEEKLQPHAASSFGEKPRPLVAGRGADLARAHGHTQPQAACLLYQSAA